MFDSLGLIVFAVAILNTVISVRIVNRKELDKRQKSLQLLITWLLPIIGAIGIWAFHKSDDEPIEPSKPTGSSGLDNYTVGGD